MNNHYDIAIIGGGASGLFCACMLKIKNPSLTVAIIEKQNNVGKKLLATGNGRCNLTNIYAKESQYHGSFDSGIKHLLHTCPPDVVIGLFRDLGLFTTIDNEGRVYPLSKQSNSVLDVLKLSCKKHGVNIICDTKITSILKNKSTYKVMSKDYTIIADKLVIATGSKATPETGADDSVLYILKNMGHTITALYPALSPVKVKSKILNSIKGVRVQGEVSILSSNNTLRSERGEIQFTDKTISGICVFNLSRIANSKHNTEITVSLLPDTSEYDIKNILKNKLSLLSENDTADTLLVGIFNRKLCSALLREVNINRDKTISQLTEQDISNLAHIINNWKFKVIKSDDFTRAQIVAGGISGNEIHSTTMESKIHKNMYIIGEAVDCDGDCGGLNLQFAFSSAYCAACELAK